MRTLPRGPDLRRLASGRAPAAFHPPYGERISATSAVQPRFPPESAATGHRRGRRGRRARRPRGRGPERPRLVRRPRQRDRGRELPAGHSAERVGRLRRRRLEHPGLRDRHQRRPQGETVHFKIDTDASRYQLDIYRMGYYGGDGARKVATVQPTSAPQTQPACLTNAATGLIDCGNWAESASWAVPADRGLGHLLRQAGATTTRRRRQPHRLRRPRRRRQLGPAVPDVGHDLAGLQRLRRQQPLRRQPRHGPRLQGQLQPAVHHARRRAPRTGSSTPSTRWSAGSKRNGYDVSYTTGVDTDRRGAELLEHKVFLSVGHDEYWSGTQRANVEAARDAGVNLAFFSGNEVFWKTRWETSIDGRTPYRTLVSYKETHANAQDRSRAERLDRHVARSALQPAGRRRPARERADRHDLHGQLPARPRRIRCPAADGKLRFWRNTARRRRCRRRQSRRWPPARSATSGTRTSTTAPGPPGLVRLSSTTVNGVEQAAGLRLDLRHRHGHPQPDAVPRTAERRARLRRRHRAVVVGPRRQPRPRQRAAERGDAAGDGQPVRRHGRPARDAAARPDRGRARRPTRRAPTPTITSPAAGATRRAAARRSRSRAPRPTPAAARRRRRGLDRRRRDLASRDRARDVELHLDARRRRARSPIRAARPTTARNLGAPPRRPSPSPSAAAAARARCSAQLTPAGTTVDDGTAIEVGVRFRSDAGRHHHRPALLPRRRLDRHASSATSGRDDGTQLATVHVRRRPRRRAGSRSRSPQPVRVDRGHDLRRLVLLERRLLRRRRRLLRRRTYDAAPLHAPSRPRTASSPTAAASRPTSFNDYELLGGRRLRARRQHAAGGHRGRAGRRQHRRRPGHDR